MSGARVATAVALLAGLAAAAPAAAVTDPNGVSKALRHGGGALVTSAAELRDDRGHSCQAGDRKARSSAKTTSLHTTRNPPVVACEQPPRSTALTPDRVAKATAAALAALG